MFTSFAGYDLDRVVILSRSRKGKRKIVRVRFSVIKKLYTE